MEAPDAGQLLIAGTPGAVEKRSRYHSSMSAQPRNVEDAMRVALGLQQRGAWVAAEKAYRELLDRFGSHPDAEHMLALTLHADGRSEAALPWFERAATKRAGATLWSNHAAALLAVGRAFEAYDLAQEALQADAKHVGARVNLGLAAEIKGRHDEAVAALSSALALAPDNRVARSALARCRLALKDARSALATLSFIEAGRDASIDLLRAQALIALGKTDEASILLAALVDNDSTRIPALNLQADVELVRGHSDAALAILQHVVERDAENRHAVVKAALLRLARGDAETSLATMRTWLDRHPDDDATASNYLIGCNYSERFDPPALLTEHRRLQPAASTAPAWPSGYRANNSGTLRIGWVSTAFSVGPMEIFCADTLRALSRLAPDIQNVLYAIGGESTGASAAAAWAQNARDLSGRSTADMVQAIRADGVDVLVDLVGRAAGNRAALFAARAAPVQIGWLDVFYPTGIDAMDFLVTDPWLSPRGAEKDFSETLLRLPHGRLAYHAPPAADIDIASAQRKQFISLNRFSKYGPAVIDVWASILRKLPAWTLLLKAHGRDDDLARSFHAMFAVRGVDPERVVIEGGGSYAEAMESYHRGSIALDPFPFSGCSTSCDALWMGLPVVTLPRETIASRQTAAWLELAGRPQWIARDADDYVSKAVQLAEDEAARVAWRRTTRDVLRRTIGDSERCARELLSAIRTAIDR